MFTEFDTKPALGSMAVWGGLTALAASVAGFFGYAVAPDDLRQAADLVEAAVAAVAGLLAIIGRIRASRRIDRVV